MSTKKSHALGIGFFIMALITPLCWAKSMDIIVRDGIVYSAQLFHDKQSIYAIHETLFGFSIHANVFNATTKELVKIKKISVIMGNHPNYFLGGGLDRSDTNPRMFSENSSSHGLGLWEYRNITENSVGGDAYFDLYDGTRLAIRGLRLEKPRQGFSTGLIPIISILF